MCLQFLEWVRLMIAQQQQEWMIVTLAAHIFCCYRYRRFHNDQFCDIRFSFKKWWNCQSNRARRHVWLPPAFDLERKAPKICCRHLQQTTSSLITCHDEQRRYYLSQSLTAEHLELIALMLRCKTLSSLPMSLSWTLRMFVMRLKDALVFTWMPSVVIIWRKRVTQFQPLY